MKKILSILLLGVVGGLLANAQSLSSSAYRAKVLEYSSYLKGASQQVVAASYGAKAAKTNRLPSISGSGSYSYQFDPAPISLGTSSIDLKKDSYDAQVGIYQNIFAGGGVRNQVRVAEAQHQISQLAKSQTIEMVTYQADVQYWTTSAYSEMYRVAKIYVSIIQKLGGIITNRFEMGAASKKDQLMVDTRLKEAELMLSYASKNYQVAIQNLNILMGEQPEAPVDALDSISMAQPVMVYSSFDSVLTNRADYRIADRSVALQEYASKATLAKYYPQLVAGVKETWGTSALNVSGNTRFNTIAFAQINVPIFSWFQRCKVKAQNDALTYVLESQRAIVVDNAKSELNASVTSLKQSYEQIEIAKVNLDYARQSLDLNTYSYEQGRIGILDVLTAQVSWIQAYNNAINAYLTNKIALASYVKALGNLNTTQE